MFSEELKKISWGETTERIASMTDTDVRRALAKERLHGPALTCRRALSRNNGTFVAQIHRGAIWQDDVDVHTSLHHQLLLQFLRLLRLSQRKPDGTHHPHARTD